MKARVHLRISVCPLSGFVLEVRDWRIAQEFDYEQRLTRVRAANGDIIVNEYDAMGARLKELKTSAGSTTQKRLVCATAISIQDCGDYRLRNCPPEEGLLGVPVAFGKCCRAGAPPCRLDDPCIQDCLRGYRMCVDDVYRSCSELWGQQNPAISVICAGVCFLVCAPLAWNPIFYAGCIIACTLACMALMSGYLPCLVAGLRGCCEAYTHCVTQICHCDLPSGGPCAEPEPDPAKNIRPF
jgi:hypothetical protein